MRRQSIHHLNMRNNRSIKIPQNMAQPNVNPSHKYRSSPPKVRTILPNCGDIRTPPLSPQIFQIQCRSTIVKKILTNIFIGKCRRLLRGASERGASRPPKCFFFPTEWAPCVNFEYLFSAKLFLRVLSRTYLWTYLWLQWVDSWCVILCSVRSQSVTCSVIFLYYRLDIASNWSCTGSCQTVFFKENLLF